ncbi:hypothetical protein [Gymnodinialimonas sp. 57CJ19]|uniref:hypothetical protein n=1 Tax=Gymnodinialimonas sp. 57CJ19 TaxID=3138498 RepID=UPI0031342493
MKSAFHALVTLSLATAPVGAESWTPLTSDSGAILFAYAQVEGRTLGFGCTAPSPQGLGLMETGSHESHLTDPFEILVEISDSIITWEPPYTIEGIVLSVDDVGYGLPPLQLNELQGSAVYLPMTDQMVLALFEAQRLVLNPGQGVAYEYPVDGLTQALDTAFSYCVGRWVEMGNPLPPALDRYQGAGQVAGVAIAPDPVIAPATPPPDTIPPFIAEAAATGCSASGYTLDAADLRIADLDGDGTDDYLLHHGSAGCVDGMNGWCGAANCSIDAFLSSQDFARREAFLGTNAGLVPMADGRTGVQISGTFSLCGETGLCPGPQVWDGDSFALAADTTPSGQTD